MADLFSLPEVVAHLPSTLGPVLKNVPACQRLNAYIHPWHLSLSENAKTGRYPSMHQIRIHFPSVVWKNYQSSREALDIKFDLPAGDEMGFFRVRYIDGHCKGIICQSILAMVIHAATCMTISVKCCFFFHKFSVQCTI